MFWVKNLYDKVIKVKKEGRHHHDHRFCAFPTQMLRNKARTLMRSLRSHLLHPLLKMEKRIHHRDTTTTTRKLSSSSSSSCSSSSTPRRTSALRIPSSQASSSSSSWKTTRTSTTYPRRRTSRKPSIPVIYMSMTGVLQIYSALKT